MKSWMMASVLVVGLVTVGRSESITLQNPSFEQPAMSGWTPLNPGNLPGWQGNWSYLAVLPDGIDGVQQVYLSMGWLFQTVNGIGQPNTTYVLRVAGEGNEDNDQLYLEFQCGGQTFGQTFPLTKYVWSTQCLAWTTPATLAADSNLTVFIQAKPANGYDMQIDDVRLDIVHPITLQNPSFEQPAVTDITYLNPGTLPGWQGNWSYLGVIPTDGTDGNQKIYLSGGWLTQTFAATGQPNTIYVLQADGQGNEVDVDKLHLEFQCGGQTFGQDLQLTKDVWATQSLTWVTPATLPANSDLTVVVQATWANGGDMFVDNVRLCAGLGQRAEAPVFSPNEQYVVGSKPITITSATTGAAIYYTTDGTPPSSGSTLYTGPVTVSAGTTLIAIAIAEGLYPSLVTSQAFIAYDSPSEIPMGNAIVDGDLSDWAGATWTPLDQDYDGLATDITEAAFAVRWSPDQVYVAVKVHDTAHAFTDSYTDWDARDAVEIYLHTIGTGPDYYPSCETAQQYTVGVKNENPSQVWAALGNGSMYPTMFAIPDGAAYFTAKGKADGEWLYYEAVLTPYEVLGAVNGISSIVSPLTAGEVIGFDVCVVSTSGGSMGYTGMKAANLKIQKSAKYSQFGQHVLQAGTITPTPTPTPSSLPGDANNDQKVDVSDLGILAANYGTTAGATWTTGDFNHDGKVDVSDLGILAANYGTGTGAALDFNADARALGLAMDAKEETPVTSTLGCGTVGLGLIAGLLLMGVVLIKMED